ncbi:hypothetical protein LG3211_0578 [Lysobacter gummosus]|nr:hypothetical protein LG3211_0578 [Lysobacter gummosus]
MARFYIGCPPVSSQFPPLAGSGARIGTGPARRAPDTRRHGPPRRNPGNVRPARASVAETGVFRRRQAA